MRNKFIFFLVMVCVCSIYANAKNLNLPPINDTAPFVGLEATVGYIKKENGEKFMIVETPEGTKLIKVITNPKKLIEKTEIK